MRLGVPASTTSHNGANRSHHQPRLAPLKESDQKELEQALEELDEFYESISHQVRGCDVEIVQRAGTEWLGRLFTAAGTFEQHICIDRVGPEEVISRERPPRIHEAMAS